MSRIRLSVAAAVVAASFAAAPAGAGAAEDQPPCDPGPCVKDVLIEKVRDLTLPTTEDVIFIVRCVGDSLGGNSCHQ